MPCELTLHFQSLSCYQRWRVEYFVPGCRKCGRSDHGPERHRLDGGGWLRQSRQDKHKVNLKSFSLYQSIEENHRRLAVFLCYSLSSKMLLDRDRIVCTSLYPTTISPNSMVSRHLQLYVLSFATIMHCTPCTVATPVMMPPAGTSSPE